jgi:histidinol dehydrogenase
MLVNAEGIATDMPAGRVKLRYLQMKHQTQKFIAADLLSQAEHGKIPRL